MPRYLLDTNTLSDAIRAPQGVVAKKIAALGDRNVCTSIVVVCELRFGILKRKSTSLTEQVERVLQATEIRSLDLGVELKYAEIRNALEVAGTPISANDMLIAAHALALDCVLVSANVREFRRVPGLVVENWLE